MNTVKLTTSTKTLNIIKSLIIYISISVYNEFVTCYTIGKHICQIVFTLSNYKQLITFNYSKMFIIIIKKLKVSLANKNGFVTFLLYTLIPTYRYKSNILNALCPIETLHVLNFDEIYNHIGLYKHLNGHFLTVKYWNSIFILLKSVVQNFMWSYIDSVFPFQFIINHKINRCYFNLYTFVKTILTIEPLNINLL